jgi:hypothetical protein
MKDIVELLAAVATILTALYPVMAQLWGAFKKALRICANLENRIENSLRLAWEASGKAFFGKVTLGARPKKTRDASHEAGFCSIYPIA